MSKADTILEASFFTVIKITGSPGKRERSLLQKLSPGHPEDSSREEEGREAVLQELFAPPGQKKKDFEKESTQYSVENGKCRKKIYRKKERERKEKKKNLCQNRKR